MKTIELNLYKYSELSEKAKQKVIEKLYDINVDYDWWQSVYDDAKEIGLKITSFDLDRNKHTTGEFIRTADFTAKGIISNHGESCETYKIASQFLQESANISQENGGEFTNKQYEKYTDLETSFLNDLLEEYANILQKESEYLQSSEIIIETIEANDYDFTENGELY